MSGFIHSTKALLRSLPRKASAIVATLLLLAIVYFALMSFGTHYEVSSGQEEIKGPGREQVRSLALGASRSEIESRFGPGKDALEYGSTGIAVEPIEATCLYYPAGSGYPYGVVQLCYRDDTLVSKRTLNAPHAD